ncbi:hypothetical protein [Desulfurobacterium sp.]|uniref:helix-turn-helix domain-containing protein n=1 Tax=Desulfurobacterium sp. TaxID=2004706 RepID=UPI00262F718D|nr:hypothetical protein [Desulfurobacterium sp.]
MEERSKVKVLESLLNGAESVEEITRDTGLSEFLIRRVLFSLESQGIVEREKEGDRTLWHVREDREKMVKDLIDLWRRKKNGQKS